MKTTLNEKAEKIKTSINGTAEKSKETIREIISSNTRQIDAAIDSNKKIIDAVSEKFNKEGFQIDKTIIENLKKTFGKSIELSEDAIDSIINAYTRQMECTVDFNTKLIDAVNGSGSKGAEKVLSLIQENFEASRQLTIKNTKEIVDSYNNHTNLALNFNKKFGEAITAQIESLSKLHGSGIKMLTSWSADWWKEASA